MSRWLLNGGRVSASEASVPPQHQVYLAETPSLSHSLLVSSRRGHCPATKALRELSLDPNGSCCGEREPRRPGSSWHRGLWVQHETSAGHRCLPPARVSPRGSKAALEKRGSFALTPALWPLTGRAPCPEGDAPLAERTRPAQRAAQRVTPCSEAPAGCCRTLPVSFI